jgi:hypothetical protein
MGILSRIKGSKLKPAWQFKAGPGKMIWRLLVSPNGMLAGEERDVEHKTSTLFNLDVTSGKTLWRNVAIDEAWWFHTAKLTPHNLYIHRFRKPDMPEPLGIITLDATTGKPRWEQPDVAMLFEYDGKVYAQREAMGRTEFFSIDSLSGEVLEAFGSERENILGLQALVPNDDTESIYSTPIAPDDEIFESISGILADVMKIDELRGSIDFAQVGPQLVFSYHQRITDDANAMLANTLSNHLAILNKESGDLLFRETLNSRTPYPVPDNFFIHRGVLIYVKETTEIVGIPLG